MDYDEANQVQNPVKPMMQVAPEQSTVPELEQVLVKIQELEQRIGDCELALAQNVEIGGQENPAEVVEGTKSFEKIRRKMERVSKAYKEFSNTLREADEITGVPEIEKNKKSESPKTAANADVPQAITSQVGEPEKTGAPVAGEETGLDGGKKQDRAKDSEGEQDAVNKVEKPVKDYPKDAAQKNALDQHPIKDVPKDTEEEEESEEGKEVPEKKFESLYKGIQKRMIKENLKRMAEKRAMSEKLSGRKTIVGMSSAKERSFVNGSQQVIKEYLNKSGIRI